MQINSGGITRRRALTIVAATAATVALPISGSRSATRNVEWTGTALGADAKLILYGNDEARARAAIADCLAEVERLENIFSLYRKGSEIRRLNDSGHLDVPSHDMRLLLATSQRMSELTEGLYDPTVQPVWELYADWFTTNPGQDGPPAELIRQALGRVGYRRMDVGAGSVKLPPIGRLTLNGIAQGYITDRVADLLRERGWRHVLVNMGELRALGAKSNGQPWKVLLRKASKAITLTNTSLATSAGEASTFGDNRQFSHLFNPGTGRSPHLFRSLTAGHESATVADALSTGLYAATPQQISRIVARIPGVRVWARDAGGVTRTFGG